MTDEEPIDHYGFHLARAVAEGHPYPERLAAIASEISESVEAYVKARSRGDCASFTCPRCGMMSFLPGDVINRYCGHCHEFHSS